MCCLGFFPFSIVKSGCEGSAFCANEQALASLFFRADAKKAEKGRKGHLRTLRTLPSDMRQMLMPLCGVSSRCPLSENTSLYVKVSASAALIPIGSIWKKSFHWSALL
jgi:hypothetical protein